MSTIESKYALSEPHHWRRITLALVKQEGGNGILRKYKDSLRAILESSYPAVNWMEVLGGTNWKSPQGVSFLNDAINCIAHGTISENIISRIRSKRKL